MGTWGTGIYSNDFAEDFKSTIAAVVRLPITNDELVKILCESAGEVSTNPDDEDYSTFWLVLADQFHKRGINDKSVFKNARAIIRSRSDLKMNEQLGMTPTDLKKRAKVLEAFGEKLKESPAEKSRKTLKGPEPFVAEEGDLIVLPGGKNGECINPYMSAKLIAENWTHKKWRGGIVLRTGRAFGYLAWYWIAILKTVFPKSKRPDEETLLGSDHQWIVEVPHTCSKSHFKKMQMEIVGHCPIKDSTLKKYWKPYLKKDVCVPDYQTIHDISIANAFLNESSIDAQVESLPSFIGLKTIAKK